MTGHPTGWNDGDIGLVGRQRELDELRAGLRRAQDGHGKLVMVAGDPGVGKTALAQAIAAEAIASGALTLWANAWGRSKPLRSVPAYWHWAGVVAHLAARCEISPLLAQAMPRLTGMRAGRESPAIDSRSHDQSVDWRSELFAAVGALLRESASGAPIVLVLDDLDGADHSSLQLLGALAPQLRDSSILVIGTYCEAKTRVDARLAGTMREITRNGHRLALRGLCEDDVADVVERIAGYRSAPPVVRTIHRASRGRPLFVDAAAQLLGAGRIEEVQRLTPSRFPKTLRETIRLRTEPLPGSTRALLCAAAVVGGEFRTDTLGRVCKMDAGEVGRALGEAVQCGVIVRGPPGSDFGAYGFSNGWMREMFYDALLPHVRGELHRDVALALEEIRPGVHVAELAYHFHVAAVQRKATQYAVAAGRRAASLAAYEEAVGHFTQALHAVGGGQDDDDEQRCDILLELGTAQGRAGDAAEARKTFLVASSIAQRVHSPKRLARAALGYGGGMGGFEFGRVDDVLVGLLEKAREQLGCEDEALLARVLGRLAAELYFSDRVIERIDLGEQAVAMARRIGDRATLASTLSARFLTLPGTEEPSERLGIADAIVALAEEVGNRKVVLRGQSWRIMTLMELGDWDSVVVELDAHEQLARQLRDPLYLWHVPRFRATIALLEGRLEEAERLAGEALAVGREAQAQNALQLYAVQLAAIRSEQGRLEELTPYFDVYGQRYPASPIWRATAAYARATLGELDRAREEFEALTADDLAAIPRDWEWLACVALLVQCGAILGDARRSALLAGVLAPYTKRTVMVGQGAVCLGPVSRFAGLAAMTAGDPQTATVRFSQALRTAQRWNAAPFEAAINVELRGALRQQPPPRNSPPDAVVLRVPTELGELSAGGDRLVAGHEQVVLRRQAGAWSVCYRGRETSLGSAKGFGYIARLVAVPQVEFHALDLAGEPAQPVRAFTLAMADAAGLSIRGQAGGDTVPPLDNAAKAAYRARILELRQNIEQAESFHDPERAQLARDELGFIARELAAAVGLRGRDRQTGSDSERARVNVTRAIRSAVKRIGEHDVQLAELLGGAIRTGTFCVYAPPAEPQLEWAIIVE